jgi:hypothetical protein
MWIPRDIEPHLQRSARTRPVVLTGARQTGKTSTFRRLFPNHEFVSLDLPTEAEQAEKEPQRFLRRHSYATWLVNRELPAALSSAVRLTVFRSIVGSGL